MIRARLVQILKKNAFLRFFVNLCFLISYLWRSDFLSIRHLSGLHEIWLKVERHDRNMLSLAHFMYPNQAVTKSKDLYRAREYQVFSQNGEDGLLLYIFSQIGATNRFFVEFGAGGATSNTRNLSTQFGWNGASFDGDETSIAEMRKMYGRLSAADTTRTLIAETVWLSEENVKHQLTKYDIPDDFDLFSMDIDGIDYWLWRALEKFRPRVVVVEYNASLGADAKLAIPYERDFCRWNSKWHPAGWYYGASLSAWVELAKSKGYELIACESTGVNAFFVRADLLVPGLPVQTAVEAFYTDARRAVIAPEQQQMDDLKQFPWVETSMVIYG
jgi:hypothetical protein